MTAAAFYDSVYNLGSYSLCAILLLAFIVGLAVMFLTWYTKFNANNRLYALTLTVTTYAASTCVVDWWAF